MASRNRPILPGISHCPNASIKYSIGPLWSNISTYGNFPCNTTCPITLNTLLSDSSIEYNGDRVFFFFYIYITAQRNKNKYIPVLAKLWLIDTFITTSYLLSENRLTL